jgi:hypothetical protein
MIIEIMTTPLSSLLVAEDELASEKIADTLQGIIQIGKGSGSPIPTGEFEQLDRTTKMLAYLLALRAANILGVNTKVGANAEEIAAIIGWDTKSVREYASRMKRRFLARGPDGYEVPVAKIQPTCSEIALRRKAK